MAPVGTDTESTYNTTKKSPLNEVMGHWSVGIIDSADSACGADLAHGAKAKGAPSSNGVAALPAVPHMQRACHRPSAGHANHRCPAEAL